MEHAEKRSARAGHERGGDLFSTAAVVCAARCNTCHRPRGITGLTSKASAVSKLTPTKSRSS
eukprot:13559593-Alexandrium_andersonii.AAC.1